MVWTHPNTPFDSASPWRGIDLLTGDFLRTLSRPGSARAYPSTNVFAGEDALLVVAEVPGFGPADVDVSVEGNVLTLRSGADAPRAFERSFRVPFRIEPDGVAARLEHGMLRVAVPRAEQDKVKRIEVTSS